MLETGTSQSLCCGLPRGRFRKSMVVESSCREQPQILSRASLDFSPLVAWHNGRQNSTGRETSF